MKMNFSKESLEGKLLALPCHFSWSELKQGSVGSALEKNIENLEEHIQENLKGTEIESYNLMGFYKTEQKCFEEARQSFKKALEYETPEDQKVVSLSCLAWLTWKEGITERSVEITNQVHKIIRGRRVEEIHEIMAEKAFAIANSGFSDEGFAEALVSIDKALHKRPKNVMYKFNKVVIMQRLYLKKHKSLNENDNEPRAIKQLWEKLIETLEQKPEQTVLYGHALVHFAIFLSKTNRDFGASGKKYVEKAKEIAGSNHTIMRNVAKFYITSAGNNVSQLNEAEVILETIIASTPTDNYKEQTLLGQCLLKKYNHMEEDLGETTFVKAEKCLRKSWEINKPYMIPALNLVRLYQRKYDKTHDESTLLEAEKVVREIFRSYFDSAESLMKSNVCKAYARFLKEYGMNLAHFYCQATRSTEHEESVSGKTKSAIEEAQRFLHQYTENRENENLLNAEQIFTGIYNSLEDLKDSAKDLFHKEYSAFLKNYSRDLAFCYFEKSLRYNPQQSHQDSYKELKQLAEEKIASSVKEEQIKGHRTLKWMEDLQAGRIN